MTAPSTGCLVRTPESYQTAGPRRCPHSLNRALPGPGRDYYQRRRSEGKTNAEAIRALKRHITTAVYRTLQADAKTRAARRTLASEEDKRG